jgi:hypothetical protein|tara:strand:+ start:751 stop:2874 length:2124 start_codon:yes stop_codon:yes gene_type:complete
MVSPFMSFATGALQAVDKNIDRYRAQKAAEEEREDARAQRMKELEFQRETKLEAQRISADATKEAARIRFNATDNKNFITLGNLKIPKGTGVDRVTAPLIYLSQNREAYNAAMKDENTRSRLAEVVTRAVQTAKTEKGLFSAVAPTAQEAPKAPIVSSLYLPALKNNPELLNFIRSLEDAGVGDPLPSNNAAARIKQGGQNYEIPNGPWIQPVIDVLDKTRLGGLGRTMPQKVAKASEILGKRGYDPKADAYEGNNKFWSAASSPFVKFIADKGRSSQEELDAAMKFINDPKHGFVTIDKNTGVVKKNRDYFLLVDMYANQGAGSPDSGYGTTPLTYKRIAKEDPNIRKEVQEIQGSRKLADAAKQGLTRYRDLSRKTGSGSRITTGLLVGIPGFSSVVTESVKIINEQVLNNDILEKSAQEKFFKPAIRTLNEARKSKDEKAIAAAELRVLEVSLAYQLTSILQGGTGGRTISDTDVERALELFTGDFLNLDQKLAKIDAVMRIVDNTIERAALYEKVTGDSNANYYYTLSKLDGAGLIRFATLDNLRSGELNAALNRELKIEQQQVKGGSITNVINKLSDLGSPNYKAEVYRDQITNLVGDSEPELRDGRYVLNKNNSQKWKNAVKTRNLGTIKRVAKELEESGGNFVFDGQSGTIVPIRWSVNRNGKPSFKTIEQTPAADATPATVEQKPTTRADAILKLFGGK